MVPLNLLVPTKTRNFTFYDRAAILLDPDEMSAQRVRIAVSIFATPISRSLNLKYPYFKEFYGYAQGFFAGELTHEFPINYSVQYIWDYWNEHATISHQLSSVMAKLRLFLLASIEVQAAIANTLDPTLALLIESTIPFIDAFTDGLTFDNVVPPQPVGIGNRFLNTFVHPFDLIRFKFIFGTVFQVSIDSWNLGDTVGGAVPPPWPEELPYNPQNPNNQPPETSPGSADPEDPYGLAPPESSPRDPRLDPDEFSNAPDPVPPPIELCVRVVGSLQINTLDQSPREVDFVVGPFEAGFTAAWEAVGSTINPPIRTLFNIRVRSSGGALLSEPVTGDLVGTSSLLTVVC